MSGESCLAAFTGLLGQLSAPVTDIRTDASQRHGVHWQMLRLDCIDKTLSGNKLFKLLPYLLQAEQQGAQTLLSFGGMHSNHLHALAAAGRRFGFATVGVVRGYPEQPVSPTLHDLEAMGMRIVFADKKTYARRYDDEYRSQLSDQYEALVIPEGGAGAPGIGGAAMMQQVLDNSICARPDVIALASGTGTGFKGLLKAWSGSAIEAFPVLYNAAQIKKEAAESAPAGCNWRVVEGYEFGGMGGMTKPLADFMLAFERQQGVPLDPVYNAKLCYAIDDRIARGMIAPGSHVVSLHSGGLQGRRAMRARIERLAGQNSNEVMYECA